MALLSRRSLLSQAWRPQLAWWPQLSLALLIRRHPSSSSAGGCGFWEHLVVIYVYFRTLCRYGRDSCTRVASVLDMPLAAAESQGTTTDATTSDITAGLRGLPRTMLVVPRRRRYVSLGS